MEAQIKSETPETSKRRRRTFSLFVKGNIAILFLVGCLLINIGSWDDYVWLMVVMLALGFEVVLLLLVFIAKIKPVKKH
ncbi:hypothetical protein [Peribacillus kribbensis]|uniref:hypothetical protein n=1 Tax=Peribacillus kribbensis TaxID=356658 RepID=UPI0004127BBA|nr:hypothetical protein [Peribacillus kribbensis]